MESDRLTTGEHIDRADGSLGSKCGRLGQGIKNWVMENLLLVLTLVGVLLGFAVGFGFRTMRPTADALMWIGMSSCKIITNYTRGIQFITST